VSAEGIRVSDGRVRPAGIELRQLLPVLSRIPRLEARLRALEAKGLENQIDWLK
jgi:hypothetical protein